MFEFNIKKQRSETFSIDVNFQVNIGQMTTLIGKSGAGKSSILDAISGLIPLDEGWIKVNGKDYTHMPVHLRQFGYVKQNSLLFPHLTVLENMTYNQKQTVEKLEEYIDVFELRPHLHKCIQALSGGEAKRVSIVRTLMSSPQLLLLDEAFGSLDLVLRLKIRTYLKKQLKIPVIVVTHDVAEAVNMSDQILLIDQGKIVPHHIKQTQTPNLSVAILAGGEGTRLGGCEKAFLSVENHTFIEKILNQLSAFDDVIVSVRDATLYETLPYRTLVDETPRIGPMGGLYTSLKHCHHEHLFVWATDMPYLEKELILFMAEFISSDYDAFIIRNQNKIHPLCGIYKKTVLPTIMHLINKENYRLMDLLARVKTKYIPLSYSRFNEQVIMNVNTENDLLKLQKPAVFCVSGVKDSGKTTLISQLIQGFKAQGYQIGVIKHDGHEFEIDHVGTDTSYHRQAGSDATLIYSKTQFAFMKVQQHVQIEQLLKLFSDVDLVIIEGLKESTFPKIEVVLKESICASAHLLAVATDGPFEHKVVPTFKRSDIEGLMALIQRKVLKRL